MLHAIFWIAVGMIIGWNLLPQPQWVKNLYDAAILYIQKKNEEEQWFAKLLDRTYAWITNRT